MREMIDGQLISAYIYKQIMINIKKGIKAVNLCPANPQKKKHVNPYEQGILRHRQLSINYDKLYDPYELDKIRSGKHRNELNHLLFDTKEVVCQIREANLQENVACQICHQKYQLVLERKIQTKIQERSQKKKSNEKKPRSSQKMKSKSKSRQKNPEKQEVKIELKQKLPEKPVNKIKSRQKQSRQKQSRQKEIDKYFKSYDGQSISRIEIKQDSEQYYSKSKVQSQSSQRIQSDHIQSSEGYSSDSYVSSVVSQKWRIISNKQSRANMRQDQIELKSYKEIQNTQQQEFPSKDAMKQSLKKQIQFEGSVFEAVVNTYQFTEERPLSTPEIRSPISSDTVFYTCMCDQSEINVDAFERESQKLYTTME